MNTARHCVCKTPTFETPTFERLCCIKKKKRTGKRVIMYLLCPTYTPTRFNPAVSLNSQDKCNSLLFSSFEDY